MESLALEIGLVVAGFVLLIKGADGLVDGAASLAARWGVNPLMVGLTVVAWGTSMPEVVVSGLAAWEGKPDLALGNVLGSNAANIGLVLGSAALVLPKVLEGRVEVRERVWLLGSLGVLWWVCSDSAVTRLEAGLLLALFGAYAWILWKEPRAATREEESHDARHPWLEVCLGTAGVALGAKLALDGAEGLAVRAGVSHRVIGLSLFALGTSLPELVAGLRSAVKGQADIGIGNVIGSNVFNTLAVIGIAGLARPFAQSAEMPAALARDFPINLGFALALALAHHLHGARRSGRPIAIGMLVAYVAYVAWSFAA